MLNTSEKTMLLVFGLISGSGVLVLSRGSLRSGSKAAGLHPTSALLGLRGLDPKTKYRFNNFQLSHR
jgi:hypothetical protein